MLGTIARTVFGAFGLEVVRRSTHRGVSLHADLVLLLHDRPGAIIDAGANVGQFSRDLVKWFPDRAIVGFEPVPDTFKKLNANFAGTRNYTPVCAALGETTGTAQMEVLQDSTWNRVAKDGASNHPTVAVNMKSLDDFSRESAIKQIALLKTDCEGSDANVVRGATHLLSESRIDAVYCEINFARDGKHGDFFDIHAQLHPQFLFYGLYEYSGRSGPYFCNGLWVRKALITDR